MAGYIKIHRKLLEWGWYSVPCVKDVFIHLLITANYRDSEFQGRQIMRGQAVFGLDSLAKQLGYSVQQIRTAIGKLKETGEITTWSNRHYSVATIIRYNDYQDIDEQQTDNKPITNQQQTNNKQITDNQQTNNSIQEYKKVRSNNKEKIIKEKVGIFQNVLLTKEELEKLKSQFVDYQDRIDRLSEYIASSGKSYKSHYATILSWSRKDKADKPVSKKGSMFTCEGASFDVSKYERDSLFND